MLKEIIIKLQGTTLTVEGKRVAVCPILQADLIYQKSGYKAGNI